MHASYIDEISGYWTLCMLCTHLLSGMIRSQVFITFNIKLEYVLWTRSTDIVSLLIIIAVLSYLPYSHFDFEHPSILKRGERKQQQQKLHTTYIELKRVKWYHWIRFSFQLVNSAFIFMSSLFTPNRRSGIRERFGKKESEKKKIMRCLNGRKKKWCHRAEQWTR